LDPLHADPILSSATITFNTTTDCKDWDPTLDVKLVSGYSWEIAGSAHEYDKIEPSEDTGPGTEFPNGSSKKVFLVLSNFLVTRSRLQKGRVSIEITPHGILGDDTWKFNFILDLTFTNGDSMQLQNPEAIAAPPDDHTNPEDNKGIRKFIIGLLPYP